MPRLCVANTVTYQRTSIFVEGRGGTRQRSSPSSEVKHDRPSEPTLRIYRKTRKETIRKARLKRQGFKKKLHFFSLE
jgi:hypothetical protein